VVGCHHHEVGARAAQHTDHVLAAQPFGLELLQPYIVDAGVAELGAHVLRGRAAARRAPGMRPQRGQQLGVFERGFTVERREQEQQWKHAP